MNKDKMLIFGASEHTRYTIDIIEQEGKYEIVGILDFALNKGTIYAGYPILGTDSELLSISEEHKCSKGSVAIGDNHLRKRVVNNICAMMPTFEFVSAIHPSALLGKNVSIGKGSVLMAGVIINNDSVVGAHSFVATKASLDHDSSLGDFSSMSPGVTTGGKVVIGSCTAIGLGANILHGKRIGDHSVVGAGSLVTKDISNFVVAYGLPVKKSKR